ncbi:hypothetical protein GJAV_G00252150 [Gymnothorax javanicus]|nr:hypothetical protein GJAV_G00252150 [Gymnothorax javanicus]
MGVGASQMAQMLLGGHNRLTPKNIHQRPAVALLCSPHVQGTQGQDERQADQWTWSSAARTARKTVSRGSSRGTKSAADWANHTRAPVLSIDPPVRGQEQAVKAQWPSLWVCPSHWPRARARVYLCDIGVP